MTTIVTRYIPATNTRGSRIRATAPYEGGPNRTLTMPYPHELTGEDVHRAAAVALCRKYNWDDADRLICGHLGNDCVFVFPPKSL
jgi:hypothetical protein